MTGAAGTRTSHDQQPGRTDMNEHQRDSDLNIAFPAADQERRAASQAAHPTPPADPGAACDAARAALAGAGLNGDAALAIAGQAARPQDDQGEAPAGPAQHDASRYPARVGSITWHLLADGYTITWAPALAGCSLTLGRHGPRGEHDAYRGTGPTMQHAWDEVRAQLGPVNPGPPAEAGRPIPPAGLAHRNPEEAQMTRDRRALLESVARAARQRMPPRPPARPQPPSMRSLRPVHARAAGRILRGQRHRDRTRPALLTPRRSPGQRALTPGN